MKLHELFETKAKSTSKTFADWCRIQNINPRSLHNIDCSEQFITSLEGAPTVVSGEFDCNTNLLKSLKGCPEHVGFLYADSNQIDSIEGLPKTVKTYISLDHNKITNLHNIHKMVKKMNGVIYLRDNPITSHILGVLLIEGCELIILDYPKVHNIINKHLKGDRDVFACQEELIEAGFDEYAKL